MIILPFILNGQNLQKGENFPEVVERSVNYLKMVVDGIPDDYSATAYFNLSWENNGKPYGIPMAGNSCNIDEYITTLPKHPSDYVDYVVSVSLAYFNGEDRRITTNKVDILIDKTAYYPETENTPDIPQSQYDAFVNDVATYALQVEEAAEKIPDSIYADENGTTITDDYIELAAGEDDNSIIDLREDGIDIRATGGVKIHNVVEPQNDADAVNKKYVDDLVENIETGGGDSGESSVVFFEYGVATFDEVQDAIVNNKSVIVYERDQDDSVSPPVITDRYYTLQAHPINHHPAGGYVFTSRENDTIYTVFVYGSSATPWEKSVMKVATKEYVDGFVGDIETALDSIIAIQTELIGGDAE